MTRKAVLVGSLAVSSADEAYDLALSELGADLLVLTDGEPAPDRNRWAVDVVDRLSQQAPFYVKRDGDWSDYDHTSRLGLMRGWRLKGTHMNLGYCDIVSSGIASYNRACDKFGIKLPSLVSIPNPLDIAFFALGPVAGLANAQAFFDATVREVLEIDRIDNNEFVFQIEDAVELIGVTSVPPFLSSLAASQLSRSTNGYGLISRFPSKVLTARHFCFGDLGHKAKGRLDRGLGPVIKYVNACTARWPANVANPLYIHLPLAAGDQPPTLDLDFYDEFSNLVVPEGTRIVAGFLHEKISTSDGVRILARIESRLPRCRDGSRHVVDVAAACGLGRRSHEEMMVVIRQAKWFCKDS